MTTTEIFNRRVAPTLLGGVTAMTLALGAATTGVGTVALLISMVALVALVVAATPPSTVAAEPVMTDHEGATDEFAETLARWTRELVDERDERPRFTSTPQMRRDAYRRRRLALQRTPDRRSPAWV